MNPAATSARPFAAPYALLAGGSILTFVFLMVAGSELGWLLGISIHAYVLPAALFLVTAWAARAYSLCPLRAALAIGAFLIVLVAVTARISLGFYDISFDGQAYHQEAVYQLAHGWNPIFSSRHISPVTSDQNVKLNHYPKGPWIVEAAMYRMTGRIETGKYANQLLLVAAFLVALAALVNPPGRLGAWAVAMAGLAALNPVTVCQIFTFYVDGQMASLLVCLAALDYLSATDGTRWVQLLVIETAVLVMLFKFTGVVYAIVFLGGGLAVRVWQELPIREALRTAALAVVLGVCVLGLNPYVFNILENGNPFYPLFGKGEYPQITLDTTTPPEFLGSNPLHNLAVSVFSKSFNWPPNATLKAPWRVSRDEWMAFQEPDVLTGGFGTLFSAGLILALALFAIGAWRSGETPWLAVALMTIVIASVAVVSGSWWSRYAPQVWLIPLIVLAPFRGSSNRRYLRCLCWVVLLILGVNTAVIASVNFQANLDGSRELATNLADLRRQAPFKIRLGNFRSIRFRLQEAGILFSEDEGIVTCDPDVEHDDDFCIEH